MADELAQVQLRVNGESIQELYAQYRRGSYVVNRRYQRKLVWTVPEKRLLIDSMLTDLPIPLILLAEYARGATSHFEIIDGLQRLNAIFAFIENEYSVNGEYFNLESLGDTKYLSDNGQLVQQTPVMDRQSCLKVVNYRLPVSSYRADDPNAIDEVFRRINSSGRMLSLQEIRQAGVTTKLADLVRRISSAIRGDITMRDIMKLADIKRISIGSDGQGYGLDERSIWWIKQGILSRDTVRESRDEELVLDLLLDMILRPIATTGSDYRNAAYGRGDSSSATAQHVVESRIQVLGEARIYDEFFQAFEFFSEVTDRTQKTWASLIITQNNPRGIPRYFHALFISVHELLSQEHLVVNDWDGLLGHLEGFWDRGLSIPSGGGVWGARKKREIMDAIKGQLRRYFTRSDDPDVARAQIASSQFVQKMQMALTEQSLFELKQGFCTLSNPIEFDEDSFQKVIRTACAMANEGPGEEGWIFFGVADDAQDALRVRQMHRIDVIEFERFFISGTQHELDSMRCNIDELTRKVIQKIRSSQAEQSFATQLARTLTPFYFEGRLMWSLNAVAGNEPVMFDDKFYMRVGNQTVECVGRDLAVLFSRFPPVNTVSTESREIGAGEL